MPPSLLRTHDSTGYLNKPVVTWLAGLFEEPVPLQFRHKAHIGDVFIFELANLRVLLAEARDQCLDAGPADIRNRIEGVAKLHVGIFQNLARPSSRVYF